MKFKTILQLFIYFSTHLYSMDTHLQYIYFRPNLITLERRMKKRGTNLKLGWDETLKWVSSVVYYQKLRIFIQSKLNKTHTVIIFLTPAQLVLLFVNIQRSQLNSTKLAHKKPNSRNYKLLHGRSVE